jgi:hypothetical protein
VSVAAKRQPKKITTFELFIGGWVSKQWTPHVPESRAFSITAPHEKSNNGVTFVGLPNQEAFCSHLQTPYENSHCFE